MDFSDFINDFNQYLSENGISSNFLKSINSIDFTQDKFIAYTDSGEKKAMISEKSSIISGFLKAKTNKNYRISIIAVKNDEIDNQENTEKKISEETAKSISETDPQSFYKPKRKNGDIFKIGKEIDPNKTFNSFVVGDNSRYAFSVCQAIARNPGSIDYNPCFLYGGVGLGKTHLAQAVGNEIIKNLGFNVCYMTSNDFLTGYTNAIVSNKIGEYLSNFNDISVLIVDDIQFFEGNKGKLREGFFNVFNMMRDNNKQIICTSDRPASSIRDLEKRLSSRITQGINATLNTPDEETRYAIVKRKFSEKNFSIDEKYIKYIAEKVITNVRDLESTVRNIIEYKNLLDEEISFEIIKDTIKDKIIIEKESEKISGDLIMETVIDSMNINKKDLVSKKRTKNIVFQRDCCAYLMNMLTQMTNTEIGIMLGGRDHSTIIHSVEKMKELYQNDAKIKKTLDDLTEEIKRKAF